MTIKNSKLWVPDSYQIKCADRGEKDNLALFLDPGLGKTSILLEIHRRLLAKKKIKATLVIVPLFPLYMTWLDEIKKWKQFNKIKPLILHNKQRLFKIRKGDLYLINPERVEWLFNLLSKMKVSEWPFDCLMIDESSKFKETKSNRTKILRKYIKHFKYRYIANGTPTGNGFKGLWSQMFMVDQGATLGRYKKYYLEEHFKLIGKAEWGNYELRNKDEEVKIINKVRPNAVALSAEKHVKMPAKVIAPKYFKLPAKTQALYDEVQNDCFLEIDRTIFDRDIVKETWAPASVSDQVRLLHQICVGNVYYDTHPTGEYTQPLNRGFNQFHKEKLIILSDLIEELNGQQLFVGYKYKSDHIALKKYFGKKITFFGDWLSELNKLQKNWNTGKIQILAGQMQSVGFGLNLQQSGASKICIYSFDSNFEVFDQFIRRLYRRGSSAQTVTVSPIIAKGLYEDIVIYKRLKNKNRRHESFFNSMQRYRQAVNM